MKILQKIADKRLVRYTGDGGYYHHTTSEIFFIIPSTSKNNPSFANTVIIKSTIKKTEGENIHISKHRQNIQKDIDRYKDFIPSKYKNNPVHLYHVCYGVERI